MSYSAPVNLASNPELEQLFRSRSDLKTGDKLDGQVLKFTNDGKAVIDFGNFHAEVKTNVPLQQGDRIRLVVVEKGKQLKLKIEQVNSQAPPKPANANLMKEGQVQQEKSIEDLHARINQLLEREIKSLETAEPGQNRDNALENIGKELNRLKEYIQTRESQEPVPKEIKQEVSRLLETVEKTIKQLPQSDSRETAQRLETLSKAIRDLRTATESNRDSQQLQQRITKDISSLKSQLEEIKLPDSARKEVQQVVQKLEETAAKIEQLKLPQESQELRRIITEELNPRLQELTKTLDKQLEMVDTGSKVFQQVKEVSQQVEHLQKSIDIVLQKPQFQQAAQTPQELDALVKTVEKALVQVTTQASASPESARAPESSPAPETPRLRTQPQQPPSDRSLESVVEVPPRPPDEVQREIAIELVKLRRAMEPVQRFDPLPPEIKPRMEQLMQQVEMTLDDLPAKVRTEPSREMENLFKEVRDLRTHLDVGREFQETKEVIGKEILRLKALAEDLNLPNRKEIDALIKKLDTAVQKIAQLERADQLPELRRIISEEVSPNLRALSETVTKALDAVPRSETPPQALELIERSDQLQRDIDLAMQRLPEQAPAPEITLPQQMEKVEIALTRLTQMAALGPADAAPEVPQFSESVQTIYDNIKTALRMLKTNLRISGEQLELPEQIKDIFLNLQSDLKAAEATGSVLEQLSQLKAMIQQADLPVEKVMSEVLTSLTDIIDKIGQLNEQRDFNQIRQLVQKELAPQLKMLGDIFGNARLLEMLEGREQTAAVMIRNAVLELQSGIESSFVRHDANPSTELTQLTQITDKLASLSSGSQGSAAFAKASESIGDLSRQIESLLSRLPGNSSLDDSAALPTKIKDLLSTLQRHFEPLDIGQGAMKLVPRLKSLVKDSGVFFEKKVSDVINKLTDAMGRIQDVQTLNQLPEIRSIIDTDMKPNLLQLKDLLANEQMAAQLGDAKALDSIRRAVDDLLSNIGGQQEQAVDKQHTPQNFQAFSFHLPIKDQENAELKVFYNKGRQKESEDEYRLSLFLEMDKLGEVRSDFLQMKDDLSVTFYVQEERVKDFFNDNLDEVQEVLGPLFQSVNFNILVSEGKLDQIGAEETITQIISDKEVDVKI